MPKKLLFICILTFFASYAFSQQDSLNYLNQLRQQAGLIKLKYNKTLSAAALNHAIYLAHAKIITHKEKRISRFFTGSTPADRCIRLGFNTRFVFENVNYGAKNIRQSINQLFSAVYHRLNFLNFSVDEIGFASYDQFYVYELSNSYINALCTKQFKNFVGQYFTDLCGKNNKKIPQQAYYQALDKVQKQNPKFIAFPPNNDTTVPVFFTGEIPNPTPNCFFAGYPISFQLNPYYFENKNIKLISFKLQQLNPVKKVPGFVLTKDNDPNKFLSATDFVLIPKTMLKYNTLYQAYIELRVENTKLSYTWRFRTSNPQIRIIYLSGNQTVHINSNTTILVQLAPENCSTPLMNEISYNYNCNILKLNSLTPLTSKIFISGFPGQKAIINFGLYTLTLIIK